ncbi:MAG: PAS domain-containing protein [Nitrospirae bacterium]|nr:MAG: PAS domain-containing protein [Nitrospirota bacterium]
MFSRAMNQSTTVPHTTQADRETSAGSSTNEGERQPIVRLDGDHARDLLDWIFNHMNEGVCLVDAHGNLVMLNAQAERLLGAKAQELLHQSFESLIISDDMGSGESPNSEPASSHTSPAVGRLRTMRRLDGRPIRLRCRRRPVILSSGEMGELLLVDPQEEAISGQDGTVSFAPVGQQHAPPPSWPPSRDTVDRSKRMQLQFLAKISHELRTPMHAILGFASLAIEKWGQIAPETLLRYVALIRESGDRLVRLVNALLDLSKLQAGHIHLRLEETDFRPLVEQVIVQMESLWRENGLSIRWEHSLPTATVTCDVDRVTQVVWNLLSNAVKFSPQGGTIFLSLVEDTLPAGRREDDYDWLPAVRLSIRDQGEGIPPNECSSIFDPFVQASGHNRFVNGTGLGLAICREIVLAHGGKIWADNHPSGGTIVSVTLPQWMPGWLRDTGFSSSCPQAPKQDT